MTRRFSGVHWLLAGAVAVVISAVVGGMLLLGSPTHQRELRLDQQRVDDLIRLSAAIDTYAAQHDKLPASLALLNIASMNKRFISDPVSRQAYTYTITASHRYELCANFSQKAAAKDRPLPTLHSPSAIRWQGHDAGHACFTFATTSAADQRKP